MAGATHLDQLTRDLDLEQFVLYTGIRPSDAQVRAAEEFMRAQ